MKRRYVLKNPAKLAAARAGDRLLAILAPFLRRPLPARPKVIGCLLLDHIGDVVLATPALRHLRISFPEARIVVFVGPWASQVLRGNPDVDEIVEFAAPWFRRDAEGRIIPGARRRGIKALTVLLREYSLDLALDFRGDFRHIVAMYRAAVSARAGFGITGGGLLLTAEAHYPIESHAVIRHLALALAVADRAKQGEEPPAGVIEGLSSQSLDEVTPEKNPLIYEIDADALSWAHQWALMHRILRPRAVLHPGAGRADKIWPAEKWHELLLGLRERGYSVIITGSPEEKRLALAVTGGSTPYGTAIAAGDATLVQTAALISGSELFVGEDTGPLHIAAATGVRTIGLFGANSDPEVWAPWSKNARVVTPAAPGREPMDGIEAHQILSVVDGVD